jgi:hypothetical protein
MKYKCPYHQDHVLKPSEHNKDALICQKCKNEKVFGRDGIFAIKDLEKPTSKVSDGLHPRLSLSFQKKNSVDLTEEDDPIVKNIYDDAAYDDYDGF